MGRLERCSFALCFACLLPSFSKYANRRPSQVSTLAITIHGREALDGMSKGHLANDDTCQILTGGIEFLHQVSQNAPKRMTEDGQQEEGAAQQSPRGLGFGGSRLTITMM